MSVPFQTQGTKIGQPRKGKLLELLREAATDVGKGYIDTEFLKMLCEERIAAATQGETNTLNVLLVRRAVDEEETWQINVVFSAIPHVQADFIERATDAGRISEISQSEKFVLVETDLAHIAFGKDEIVGLPLFLYIDRKISNSKHLSMDVSSADKGAQFLRSLLNGEAAILLDGVRAWMWVPLAIKGRIIGGVGVAHTKRNYFTSHHADLALTVANQAAITMVNAELYQQAQALAALQERQRLAQNLHDAVNQSLFSAGLIAEVLPRLWDRDQAQARQSLEDLRRLTRGAMAEMRALLAELRPSTLTDADLGDLLRLLGNAFTGRTNIPATVTIVGEGVLPAEVQVAVYRVCQEALNNIAKHAGASKVEINLKHDGTAIELGIHDNGQGFDPEQTTGFGHYGLSMMREHAEAVGAQLFITSQIGRGSELVIRWRETEKKEVLL